MYSEQLLNLGRIHFYLVNANQIRSKLLSDDSENPSALSSLIDEIEDDEINWWVFKRESNIVELSKKTEIALQSAVELKRHAVRISNFTKQTLKQLIQVYELFVKERHTEILNLLDYVDWLYKKDKLAPSILFNYRTWGSSRISDRLMDAKIIDPNDLNDTARIEQLTNIVLGITKRGREVYELVRYDMEEELYGNLDLADLYSIQSTISDDDIEIRAAYQASRDFAEYFSQLRISLEHVLNDIKKRGEIEQLSTSDVFWRDFIIKAYRSNKTEQKYWDFKETLDMWHTKGDEKKVAEHKFAELVAGFGNSEGGVIIVGVTDSLPRKIVGIGPDLKSIENQMKYTREAILKYIKTDHDFFLLNQVNVPDNQGSSKLCLVILIDQTYTPIEVKNLDGKSYSCPIRSETGLSWSNFGELLLHRGRHVKSKNRNFLTKLNQFRYEAD